jgi:hemolysin activation/secretion protein
MEPEFTVTKFHIDYFNPLGRHWTSGLRSVRIDLGKSSETYTAPRASEPVITETVGDLLDVNTPRRFDSGALLAINDSIRHFFEREGLLAVKVYVDPSEIQGSTQLQDVRAGGDTDLHLVVLVGKVGQVHVAVSGRKQPMENELEARIRRNSPVRAARSASTQPSDAALLKKNALDDYIFRLNRQPGRRVDATIAPGVDPGTIDLNYLVQESKPWSIYGQVSNTGTRQTRPLRERFGVLDSNLTGNDDVLSIDYVTADFDPASQAVMASYEFPILADSALRARTYGSYSSFVASDVGLGDEHFSGNQTVAGAELIGNIYQYHALFLDAFAGMRFESISSANQTAGTEGSADFGIPYVGLRLQRATAESSLFASVTGESGFTEADQSELDALGRTDIDKRFGVLQSDVEYSFFLEPLIHPNQYEQGSGPMANEVAFSFRGQSALGSRLVPEEQQTVGGLYTVRGYPESLTAGDDMILASAEYRLHVPRLFTPAAPQKIHWLGNDESMRWVPDRPGGQADWDLILKAFVDGAHVWQSDRALGEDDSALLSIGVGAELQFRQNLNAQVYWGVPLVDVNGPSVDESVKAGSSRVSFSVTLFY